MRWNGPEIGLAALVVLCASPSPAGESFLDRNSKVHDAVPYGRDDDVTPRPGDARAASPTPHPTAAP